MSKEVRAVVLGLVVVVLAAIALSFWRRPAAEFSRIKGFRIEVHAKDGDETRNLSFNVPANLVARVAKLAPVESLGGDIKANWGKGDVTPQEVLDAAEESAPGKPGVIQKDGETIEVVADGEVLEIDIKDEWDKHVHIRLPRLLIEALSEGGKISTSEILRKLDELGPGDVVTIKDKDNEVTITAEPRKGKGKGLHIS
jgi:hypothetical protein